MNDSRAPLKDSDFSKLDLRNEEVFISLYDHFAPKLVRHAYFRLGNEEEAKDAVAQVFLKTWEYLGENNPKRSAIKNVRAFLYQLINNQIIDFYRKKSRTEVSLEGVPHVAGLFADVRFFKESQERFDAQKVLQVVKLLKEDYQQILLWRYVDELGIAEISQILGKSRGAVSVMLFRALRDLKRILKDKGF